MLGSTLMIVAEYPHSMRRAITVGLLCVGCTRVNPAFDEQLTLGEGDESETGLLRDLGSDPSMCEYTPTEGLSIHVGAPEDTGGQCPTGVDIGAKILSAGSGQIVIEDCAHGCEPCFGTQRTISAFPLLVDNHVPSDPGKCVSIEAHGPLGAEPGACHFGGLTIYEAGTPFVIATTHSYEPTMRGLMLLVDSQLPEPMKAGNCNCDAVGQGNDCCYGADGPPEFWYYPFEGAQLFPGDSAPIDVPDPANLAHAFKLFQAQVLHPCESPERELSWAVVAEL
jgi:hypothetical protein